MFHTINCKYSSNSKIIEFYQVKCFVLVFLIYDLLRMYVLFVNFLMNLNDFCEILTVYQDNWLMKMKNLSN
jgi:hypothetical protein